MWGEIVAADDGDDWSRLGTVRNDDGKLSEQGLLVQPSFAGDDQIRSAAASVEVEEIEEEVGARGESCTH